MSHLESHYRVRDNLDDFIRRIKKGMELHGRIIDRLGEDKYLLRVWGYNILTESRNSFNVFEEIKLMVKETDPLIVFDLCSSSEIEKKRMVVTTSRFNLLVH